MSTKFIAIVLAALLTAAGVLSFSGNRSSSEKKTTQAGVVPVANSSALASDAQPNTDAYLNDFKAGYADGFNTGVSGASYPDEASMTSNANGYVDGFSQGFTDGQGQQAALRGKLCRTGETVSYAQGYGSGVSERSYASSSRGTSAVLGDRASYNDYRYAREDRGVGSTTRKALLIAGGAAAGAGLGGALGGKKGALIGALAGGGTGTVLALKNKPSRAFNRRVSKKSVLTKTLIGAGAGAAIGALAGGKRGALAGVALGGGGGALWSLMTGKRRSR
jgi:hypothetical protein